ncbi:hypothetical protein JCM11251_005635 [Rhodosporidiobolus azoricus]
MGLFLRGRIITWLSVLVAAICATFATFFYAWNFSRKWPNPTNFTKVIKIFAMIFHSLFALQSLFTAHSLHQNSRSLSFGLWSVAGLASIVFDMWWFAMMVSRKGFDAVCGGDDGSASCARKNITLAFIVFIFFYSLLRLLVLLFVFHFDVKYNETLPTAAPASAPASATAPAMTSVARSLAKRLGAPAFGVGRRQWGTGGRVLGTGKRETRGVPLINVSMHDESAGQPALAKDDASIYFDADLLLNREELSRRERHRHQQVPTNEEDAFDARSSSEESELTDEEDADDAQMEYERRRRERKGRGKEGGAGVKGVYEAV